MKFLSVLAVLPGAFAAMRVQTFDDDNCAGNVVDIVATQAGEANENSGCSTGAFGSVRARTADPGFKCQIYSDNGCQFFIAQVTDFNCITPGGNSINCFSEDSFVNPLAGTTADVSLGLTKIPVRAAANFIRVRDRVGTVCSDKGCDPTTPEIEDSVEVLKKGQTQEECDLRGCDKAQCTSRARLSGAYDNANARDYLAGLISSALESTQEFEGQENRMLSFVQVVLNDRAGNDKGQMSITWELDCPEEEPVKNVDCDSLLATGVETALGLVPQVGEFLAPAFSVGCSLVSAAAGNQGERRSVGLTGGARRERWGGIKLN
ncbi:hypothetical protein EJ04DRAFT_516666 [Polyplosphaeria fusca]|uniref:Uncharacterized protein n=1 Tax=Polyplosphaeria fusca TaxID=682080 RepID=A0A9P4UTY9_9PLEO|nr:hypothetical protein EJ04DRAFT_516666 [Polyplosphaeria fusca]